VLSEALDARQCNWAGGSQEKRTCWRPDFDLNSGDHSIRIRGTPQSGHRLSSGWVGELQLFDAGRAWWPRCCRRATVFTALSGPELSQQDQDARSDAPSDVEVGAASANLLEKRQHFEGGVGAPAEQDASRGARGEKNDRPTLVTHHNRVETRPGSIARKPLNQHRLASGYTQLPLQKAALLPFHFFCAWRAQVQDSWPLFASETAPESAEPSSSSTI
jgi:hypothetical protein